MTEPLQVRDEPATTVRARLERLGVLDDLARLPGWQRGIVHDALDVAHVRDRRDDEQTLAGARYLEDMAEVYRAAQPKRPNLLADVLHRAATAHLTTR
jgi:hypothetical protein